MVVEGVLRETRRILMGSRCKKHLKVVYDKKQLPMLPNGHLLSKLYLQEAHTNNLGGWDSMVMWSWANV
jgi:hypothetical protein